MSEQSNHLPLWVRTGHAAHCKRCLSGLPSSQVEVDASRLALVFYCIGSLDLLGLLNESITGAGREYWREWIWEQQTRRSPLSFFSGRMPRPDDIGGRYGTGFKPSPYMTPEHPWNNPEDYSDYDTPHVIMTYTALLSLSILRDDFSRLDRPGLLKFLRSLQREDGSFSTVPQSNESDLRTVYCAFAISSMLDDWSGINIERAIAYIATCRTYEGGYGQSPFGEAHGGTTYIAIASLHLVPSNSDGLTPTERAESIRWLIQNQDESGGFRGRTGKEADACYCFWCGAALQILGVKGLVDAESLLAFLSRCQFKYGGIAKAPGEHPDPFHTYLSLAALSMYSPVTQATDASAAAWQFEPLDPLLNATEGTARWAREHIPAR